MERVGEEFFYPGPRVLADRATPVLLIDGGATVGQTFAAGADIAVNDEGASLRAAYALARWRVLQVWAGRRAYGLSSGPGSSLVLNEHTPFTGVGFALPAGVRLPLLRRVYFDGLVARLPHNGPVQHPYFLASRLTIAPHRDLAIGLNRAAIFGGEDELSITPWRVLLMLLGRPDYPDKDSDFENQVASVDLLWRTRIGPTPVALHGEWAADDAGFAFWHVPGLSAGVEVLQLPGVRNVAVGIEGVYFGRRVRTYPPWYRHAALADGWSERGRLLGHPLGGDGSEGALLVRYVSATVTAQARGYARQRGVDNLFAPARAGNSIGGEATVSALVGRLQLAGSAEGEGGNGWSAARLRLTAGLEF
jgi:hypothetical protein